ncbi:MAG: hypothetical protein IPK21_05545 [Haliscomenobacter sp.]|nr:hypothetical protein [Haliscomenobacter sp.]
MLASSTEMLGYPADSKEHTVATYVPFLIQPVSQECRNVVLPVCLGAWMTKSIASLRSAA